MIKRVNRLVWIKQKQTFSSTKEPQNGSESDKRPYIQNKQQQNIIPYILLGIRLLPLDL